VAGVVPFTSAAKRHFEKIGSYAWTPGASAVLLTTGTNSQVKAYPYLRSFWLHVTATGGTGGTMAADGPWNSLTAIMVADSNGSAIYGSQLFTGYDAYLAHLLSGRTPGADDPTLFPFSSLAGPNFEFAVRLNLEFNHRTGAGCLPNMSSNAAYGLFLTGNTVGNIWSAVPSPVPSVNVDVWMECWTLPKEVDLAGRNQMQGPPLLGTTQYTSKQTYTNLVAGSNTITVTRKGNMWRKLVQVLRNGAGARVAVTNYPNPYEFWWDGNRLTSDDPKHIQSLIVEENDGLAQSSGLAVVPVGVLVAPYDFSAPYGSDYGGDGEGGWLATTQAGRYEFVGSNWNAAGGSLDVITMDVAPIALHDQYQLDAQTGKLLYPAQIETRG